MTQNPTIHSTELLDEDGMARVNILWTIQGKTKTTTGKLYALHAQELEVARQALRRRARRGDTITVDFF